MYQTKTVVFVDAAGARRAITGLNIEPRYLEQVYCTACGRDVPELLELSRDALVGNEQSWTLEHDVPGNEEAG